jgi:hypothetical protein
VARAAVADLFAGELADVGFADRTGTPQQPATVASSADRRQTSLHELALGCGSRWH